ncbi:MAG: STAS domain-containing protein [Clostridiales bacterium]|nr:STAS domain-containing protein [Clostridiales bacterium]
MIISRAENGSSLILSLEGRLDTNAAPELEKAIFDSLDGINELTLDLEKLDYISSSGLRVLLLAEKEMEKRDGMRLINVCEPIMDIFEVTGFVEILTID